MSTAPSSSSTSPTRVDPDPRLCGVWSREHLAGVAAGHNDVRIIYMPDRTGRYETWGAGLTEVVTFKWFSPTSTCVTMEGCEYVFRDDQQAVRREPCDWNFPAVPFEIAVEPVPAGVDMPLLKLHFTGGRIDTYGLVTADLTGWEDFHF
ncbi:MAG: hypothetical protein QOF78_4117 [Phycisphaerales bacterium]|jgi:hypothetical protein|nr:hypothetical protein [Phycisphaerales bacterium]